MTTPVNTQNPTPSPNPASLPLSPSEGEKLKIHYMERHQRTVGPWHDLIKGAAAITAIALVIMAELQGIAAIAAACGVMYAVSGIGKALINWDPCRTGININLKAAEALAAPGFFDWALKQNLANTADSLVWGHGQYASLK